VSPWSHLTSYTPTKSNVYLINSLATDVSESDLYRLLTIQVRDLTPLFHCLRFIPNTKYLFMFHNYARFYSEHLFTPHAKSKLEDIPLSAVRDCVLNIFAATFHIGGRSSIGNLRTRHTMLTGTHVS